MISHTDISDWLQRRKLARPFLRWAGGKQPFLHRYGSRIPNFSGSYFEPFLGSGAVFFYVQRTQSRPHPAILSDINLQLILTYYAVRDEPETVFGALERLKSRYLQSSDRGEFYHEVRSQYNDSLPAVEPAVFLFLNRTCWNGLYRLNRDGKFNVPHGKGEPSFPDLPDLLNASAALKQAQLRASSWENSLGAASPNDFVFLDPPYYSDQVARVTKYARAGARSTFDIDQHKKLLRHMVDLKKRRVDFLLTNSAERQLIELYTEAGLHVERTVVPRFISSDIDNRVAVEEILVSPSPPLRLV